MFLFYFTFFQKNILKMWILGTTYLILQFAAVDILSTWVAASEIWSLFSHNWQLNSIICPLFLGTEVLVNVIIVYLHILLNFHAISAWNMQQNTSVSVKNPLTSDIVESNECLVWAENSVPNRIINIDYRHKKTSVSIIVPCILIWFSCLSLSIPEYTLSTTVEYHTNKTLCTIVDLHYTQLLQMLLVFFRDLLPVPLLVLTFIIAIFKICNNTSLSIVKKNSSAKKFKDLKKLLKLGISLSLFYILTSFQRSSIQFLHIISPDVSITLEKFKMPPLDNFVITQFTNLFLSMLHYFGIIIRPILFIVMIPSVISTFRNRVFKSKSRNK